jgi:hypothetical protein
LTTQRAWAIPRANIFPDFAVPALRFLQSAPHRSDLKKGPDMAKATTIKIKLLSTADTGYFYVTKKNSRTRPKSCRSASTTRLPRSTSSSRKPRSSKIGVCALNQGDLRKYQAPVSRTLAFFVCRKAGRFVSGEWVAGPGSGTKRPFEPVRTGQTPGFRRCGGPEKPRGKLCGR